nr:MAG TPA: hypothetical protein [Caudoviricetes sp.]
MSETIKLKIGYIGKLDFYLFCLFHSNSLKISSLRDKQKINIG